jgi:hypothetical protein
MFNKMLQLTLRTSPAYIDHSADIYGFAKKTTKKSTHLLNARVCSWKVLNYAQVMESLQHSNLPTMMWTTI